MKQWASPMMSLIKGIHTLNTQVTNTGGSGHAPLKKKTNLDLNEQYFIKLYTMITEDGKI